jgi:hypothetical protein
LSNVAQASPVVQKRLSRPTQHVDEPWADDVSCRIYDRRGRRLRQFTDRSDSVAANGDVDDASRRATAVHHQPAANDYVVIGLRLFWLSPALRLAGNENDQPDRDGYGKAHREYSSESLSIVRTGQLICAPFVST